MLRMPHINQYLSDFYKLACNINLMVADSHISLIQVVMCPVPLQQICWPLHQNLSVASCSEVHKVYNLPTEAQTFLKAEARGADREGERGKGKNSPPTAIISPCTVIWLSEAAGSMGWNNVRERREREKR